jgi:hypothetical protein
LLSMAEGEKLTKNLLLSALSGSLPREENFAPGGPNQALSVC